MDSDVIVSGSAERTKVLVELARELNLPFVEFNFAFVKGDLNDGEGGSTDHTPLTQCWLSLGGYDSLFAFQRIHHRFSPDGHSSIGCADLSLEQYLSHKDVCAAHSNCPGAGSRAAGAAGWGLRLTSCCFVGENSTSAKSTAWKSSTRASRPPSPRSTPRASAASRSSRHSARWKARKTTASPMTVGMCVLALEPPLPTRRGS